MRPVTVLLLLLIHVLPLACSHTTRDASSDLAATPRKLSVLSLTGYETRSVAPHSSTSTGVAPPSEPLHALVIDDVEFSRDGKQTNVDVGFVQRLASDLRKAGFFHTVYDPANSYNAPKDAVHIRLVVSDEFDKQWGERLGKDMLVGLSYLVLAPVMPYEMEYAVSIRATMTLPDESTVDLESVSKMEVKYKHMSDRLAAEDDLKRTGMNDCVSGLLTKMKTDAKLIDALKAK